MWIEQEQLLHFRNYTELQLDCDPHKNLFIGDNAAGKSNILEAIYILSHGKSYRTRSDRELIQWNASFAKVKLQVHSSSGGSFTLEMQMTLSPENTLKTVFKLNGNPVRSRSEIVGKIPTVTFFLSDLQMLRGAPDDRRSAIDSALVQYEPMHFKRITAYNRVRQQKSQLLKQFPQGGDMNLLESLNQQLVTTGVDLMLARMRYLRMAETLAELRYHELSQGKECLTLAYQPSFEYVFTEADAEQLTAAFVKGIEVVRQDELRRGQVLVGPHRDDVRFYLDSRDACMYGSQGQQRSIVLAMKLAEIEILKRRLQDEAPILLLDDVMAELDPARQKQLLMHLDSRMQVFLTTTHLDSGLELFQQGAESARLFQVRQGQVESGQSSTVGGILS